MSHEELQKYAEQATVIRKDLISHSLSLLDGEPPLGNKDDPNCPDLKVQLHRKYTRLQRGVEVDD